MSKSKGPPRDKTPRVHRQGPAGQQGPLGAGPPIEEQLGAEDLKNPVVGDFLDGRLPDHVAYEGDQPEDADKLKPPAPQTVISGEQAARAVCDQLYTCYTKTKRDLWPTIEKAIKLGYLLDGIDPRAVRVAMPFNSAMVLPGGMGMIRTVQTDTRAEVMDVDIGALGKDVAFAERVGRAHGVLEKHYTVVDANRTVVLNRIADRVDAGLKLGKSVIDADGGLAYALRAARAIRGEPMDAAVAARAQNARTQQSIEADVQAKLGAETPKEMPAQSTTTVTTQTGPAPGTSTSKAPLSTGVSNKK